MAVTYQHTATGRYMISREFDTLAAAARGAAALESVSEQAFQPEPAFTGGRPVIEFEADPMLRALVERSESADDPNPATAMGINNGTAHDPASYAAATAGQRETGE